MTENVNDSLPVSSEAKVDLVGEKAAAENILRGIPSLVESFLGLPAETNLDELYAQYAEGIQTADNMIKYGASMGRSEEEIKQVEAMRNQMWSTFKNVSAIRGTRDSAMEFLGLKPKPEAPQA